MLALKKEYYDYEMEDMDMEVYSVPMEERMTIKSFKGIMLEFMTKNLFSGTQNNIIDIFEDNPPLIGTLNCGKEVRILAIEVLNGVITDVFVDTNDVDEDYEHSEPIPGRLIDELEVESDDGSMTFIYREDHYVVKEG